MPASEHSPASDPYQAQAWLSRYVSWGCSTR